MSLSELSPIHVAKDEERQSPARSFMILQICGKQLHRSVICGAHDFQCVWAVDIVLAVAEWQHSSSLFVLAVCAPIQRNVPPCSTLPKVCEDCESGPVDVLNVIASKPDLRQHAYYEGLRLFRAIFSNLAIRSRPSAVLMRSLASEAPAVKREAEGEWAK